MPGNTIAPRYERLALQRSERSGTPFEIALTDRDVNVCETVRQLRFATKPQLAELWWPGAVRQAPERRLLKLFEAGYLDRLRPHAPRSGGSFPWVYCLARRGHELLVSHGFVAPGEFRPPRVVDFAYILHDLEVNDWVLAYRRRAGERLVAWAGEPDAAVRVPPGTRASRASVRQSRPKPLRPDALLEIGLASGKEAQLFIELDRTRRPDKNYDKLERYDSFLTDWSDDVVPRSLAGGALVLFVVPDEEALEAFLRAADRRLTGRRAGEHPGRLRTFFTVGSDIHEASAAWRVSATPGKAAPRKSPIPGLV